MLQTLLTQNIPSFDFDENNGIVPPSYNIDLSPA